MRIFLAGDSPWSNWQAGPLGRIIKRRLISYFYHGFKIGNRLTKEVRLSHACGMDLFLDSGAYTQEKAKNEKTVITVDSYADFINQHGDIFSLIANLDVIGDTGPKSWSNLKALESLGCPVIPVFHYQDDIRYLKKMLDNYPFIALGGLVGAHHDKLRIWLDEIWYKYLSHKDGTPRLNVHGFGCMDFDLMKRYPWFSIDSSSWAKAGIFGSCVFYENGKLHKIIFSADNPARRDLDGLHYDRLAAIEKLQVDKWLRPHGVTAQECAADFRVRNRVNAATYQNLETIGVKKLRVLTES